MPIQFAPSASSPVNAAEAAAAVSVRALDSCDLDEVMAWGAPWDHLYRQASPGRFRARSVQVRTASMELTDDRFATSVLIEGAGLENVVGFAVLAESGQRVYANGLVRAGDVLVLGDRRDVHVLSKDPGRWIVVAVGLDRLAEWSDASGNQSLIDAAGAARLSLRDASTQRSLQRSLSALVAGGHWSMSGARLEHEVLWAFASSIDQRDAVGDDVNGVLAHRARSLIDASVDRNQALLEIYNEIGAAPRTVQKAFRRRYGVSPRTYRRLVQLDRARCALERRSRGSRVGDAAMSSGFMHLGRFSSTYRSFFGERPSETLRGNTAASQTGAPSR